MEEIKNMLYPNFNYNVFSPFYLQIENPPENANATFPIKWAKKENKPIDVFIMMTFAHQIENSSEPAKALAEYRSCVQQPNAK